MTTDPEAVSALTLGGAMLSENILMGYLDPDSFTDTYYGALIRVEDDSERLVDGGDGVEEQGSYTADGILGEAASGDPLAFATTAESLMAD